jgi:hypothetical protein
MFTAKLRNAQQGTCMLSGAADVSGYLAKLLVKCANIENCFVLQVQLCLCTMPFLQTFIVTCFYIDYKSCLMSASFTFAAVLFLGLPVKYSRNSSPFMEQLVAIGPYSEPKPSSLQLPNFIFQQ